MNSSTRTNWNSTFWPRRPSSTVELKNYSREVVSNGHGFDEIKEDIIRGGERCHAGDNSTKFW